MPCEKYGIGGPEFGIKEEFVTEKGRLLFHAHTGKKTTGLHPTTALKPSTNELVTDRHKNIVTNLNFSTTTETCRDHFNDCLAKSSETQI